MRNFKFSLSSISVRIAIAIVLSVAISTITLTAFLINEERQLFRADLENEALALLNTVALGADNDLLALDVSSLNNVSEGLDDSEIIIRFYGDDGRLISSNSPDESSIVSLTPDPNGLAYLQQLNVSVQSLDNSVLVATSIFIGDDIVGAASVEVSADRLSATITRTTNIAIAVLSANIIIALFVALLITRTITRPIRSLSSAASNIASGNFEDRIDVPNNEFGQLAESFNTMASEVQSAIQTVENRSRFLQSTVEVGTLVTR
ncbi:MAG: HAMP domain-containing protein, partial [Phototrophicaceae bacterium]